VRAMRPEHSQQCSCVARIRIGILCKLRPRQNHNGVRPIHITRELSWPNRIPGQNGIFHKTEKYDNCALERITIQGKHAVADSDVLSLDLRKLGFIAKDGERIWDFWLKDDVGHPVSLFPSTGPPGG